MLKRAIARVFRISGARNIYLFDTNNPFVLATHRYNRNEEAEIKQETIQQSFGIPQRSPKVLRTTSTASSEFTYILAISVKSIVSAELF